MDSCSKTGPVEITRTPRQDEYLRQERGSWGRWRYPQVAPGSTIYLDTNSIIYSVERIEPYNSLLLSLWQDAAAGAHSLVTSTITLLETLVGPIKVGDSTLEADYRRLLQGASDVRLAAIADNILERVASLRAATNLKTPDAIHAATVLIEGCTLFVTNDPAFRRVPGLNVAVLSDLLPPDS